MCKIISYGVRTETGKIRKSNQDAVFSLVAQGDRFSSQPAFGIFIVADGAGEDRARASTLACNVIADHVQKKVLLHLLTGKTPQNMQEILTEAFQKANGSVISTTPEAGVTATAAIFIDNVAYIGHAGDCIAYVISNERCEKLTKIHDLIHLLTEKGIIKPEDTYYADKQGPYRALGQPENFEVDFLVYQVRADEFLLLCTDGLWNLVSESEIQEVTVHDTKPQSICDTLVNLASEKGGTDNTSVIVVKVTES